MQKKTTLLTLTAAAVISLTGCGGGSSSSSSPDANAKTTIQVANKSQFDFASVAIKSASGQTLYNNAFKCAASDANCYINLNQDINESVTLLFKDGNGRLVRAFTIPKDMSVTTVYPDAMSTGFYLVNRLATDYFATERISWEEVNLRLATFFSNYDSPDGTLDSYEEVGLYYTKQIVEGVASEDAFLAQFKQRLTNWDVARADELPSAKANVASLYQRLLAMLKADESPLIAPAYAQSSNCGDGLTGILTFAENLAGAIPVIGDAVSGAAAIGNSYCDSTDAKLDQISSQIATLQTSVESIASRLGALSDFLADATANTKTVEFQDLARDAIQARKQYKDFLVAEEVASLRDYFARKGGWEQGIAAGGGVLASILNQPYNQNGAYHPESVTVNRILKTTGNEAFTSIYMAALRTKCGSLPPSSTNNFLLTRQQCNNVINVNAGRLVAAQGLMLPIYKDIYATLAAYRPQSTNKYILPTDVTSYETAYGDIKRLFSDQQMFMVKELKKSIGGPGYFNAFDGLPDTLRTDLVKNQCMQSGEDRKNGPAISGWYAPTTQDKDMYIETTCKTGNADNPDARVKARYYYNANANGGVGVANVLGVPVAANYVTNGWVLNNNSANYTKQENTSWGTFWEGLELAQDIIAGRGTGMVISQGQFGTQLSDYTGNVYVRIPPSTNQDFYRIARMNVQFDQSAKTAQYRYLYQIGCVAAPCRVDPESSHWLLFQETGSDATLDLRESSRAGYLRLAPVGQ